MTTAIKKGVMRYWGKAQTQCVTRGSISEEEIIEELGMMNGL